MKKYTQLTYEQRYSIHLLNKDTVKLLLPNQWAEVNQAFLMISKIQFLPNG
jgi:hypothetical protein